MKIKKVISRQYREKVNEAGRGVRNLTTPPEGWIRTARKALGMSVAQLAKRLGVTRAHVNQTEKAELSGRVTLKTMEKWAECMGYRFVYAIVPEKEVEVILAKRAKKKAVRMVEESGKHMALEGQGLPKEQIAFEVDRLQTELMNEMPSDFWDDRE